METQHEFLEPEGDTHADAMCKKWAHQLVSKLYDLSYILWENRNSLLHAKVEANLNEKESAKLALSIQSKYDKGPRDLGPADEVLVVIDIHELMEKSVTEKKSWLVFNRADRLCF